MKINLRPFLFLVIFIELLTVSCSQKESTDSMFFQLTLQPFSDEILVEGTVEALHFSTITCSRRLDGTIVSIIEDGTHVLKGDTVCVMENRESTSRYEDLLTKVEKTKAQYVKSKADLDMSYALIVAQVKRNEAQTSKC